MWLNYEIDESVQVVPGVTDQFCFKLIRQIVVYWLVTISGELLLKRSNTQNAFFGNSDEKEGENVTDREFGITVQKLCQKEHFRSLM